MRDKNRVIDKALNLSPNRVNRYIENAENAMPIMMFLKEPGDLFKQPSSSLCQADSCTVDNLSLPERFFMQRI